MCNIFLQLLFCQERDAATLKVSKVVLPTKVHRVGLLSEMGAMNLGSRK